MGRICLKGRAGIGLDRIDWSGSDLYPANCQNPAEIWRLHRTWRRRQCLRCRHCHRGAPVNLAVGVLKQVRSLGINVVVVFTTFSVFSSSLKFFSFRWSQIPNKSAPVVSVPRICQRVVFNLSIILHLNL
jgi:hypothetical protein